MACRTCVGCKTAGRLASDYPTTLTGVMNYRNREVIARLRDKLGLNETGATALFKDMLRFLFLCGIENEALTPPPKIDKAWHEFILYTEDYAEFCKLKFGRFIHHRPESYFKKKTADTSRATQAAAKKRFGKLGTNWEYPHSSLDKECAACTVKKAQRRSCASCRDA